MRRPVAALAGLVVALVALGAAALAIAGRAERWPREAASRAALMAATPLRDARGGYLGSDRCLACHPGEHASWSATYHRTMTQVASPTAIVAPFDGRALVGVDGAYHVERRGDEHWVELVDPEWKLAAAESGEPLRAGPMVWRRVVMTTGSHHLQVYWVASADGRRLHAFPFSYLIAEARWVPNESTLLRPPEGDAVYTWNQVCIQCHAVAGIPGEGDDGEPLRSRAVELGIACEACHGPGSEHVARHRAPLDRYRQHLAHAADPGAGDPTIVNPARLDHRAASAVCGQCHSAAVFADEAAWRREGPGFRPGEQLAPGLRLVRHPARADAPWLDAILEEDPGFIEGRLWGDGMIRVIGRELSGLVESPCYQRGELSCLSCHQLHGADPNDQLAPGMEGDAACTGCHPAYASAAAAAEHSHHPATSAASRCYNCHMPHTTYGLLKASRSHEVDVPDPLVSATSGRPNACNLCHLDQTLAWSAEHLDRWYGRPAPALEGDAQEVAAGLAWALAGDASQRALVAWHMGWGPARAAAGEGWEAPILALLLEDPYDAVRMIAARSIVALPGYEDLEVDAVAPAERRAAVAAEIRRRWAASGDRRGDPQLLREADGRPREAALAELLARRDQRPIDLRE
ncbi:MAG: C cytochrome precursor [Myxococcales bacterium]|nr:C cytochrome precursor [Myxococcales bacterium]